MKLIAPSILSADFTKLGEEIRAVEEAGADWIHIDVMDGRFVPNITMGPMVVEAIKKVTSLPLDVHLMIDTPDRYVNDFAAAGATHISVHAEACVHLHRTVHMIKEAGVQAGVALNPGTDLHSLSWVMEDLDFVLIMTVNPGFGGQSFIPKSLEKIRRLKKILSEHGCEIPVQVDGGVNKTTVKSVSNAGADIFVAGSAVFGSPDYRKTISELKGILEGAGE